MSNLPFLPERPTVSFWSADHDLAVGSLPRYFGRPGDQSPWLRLNFFQYLATIKHEVSFAPFHLKEVTILFLRLGPGLRPTSPTTIEMRCRAVLSLAWHLGYPLEELGPGRWQFLEGEPTGRRHPDPPPTFEVEDL